MAKTILITGATGAVGTEVAARLAVAGHSVIGMVHQTREFVRGGGRGLPAGAVVPISGDITTPGLGLSPWQRSELRSRVDLIVHCAAVTDFGRDAALYDAVNVDGTARIIEFAAGGSRPGIALVHVSTAYVCGERDGVVSETELDTGQRFANHYEDSKFRAELSVRAAAEQGLPAVVVRPSIVTGAARTGVIRDFGNMYVVLRVLTRGLVRTIPGHYDAVIDLVPIDFVADAISQVCERFDDAAGHTLHLTGAPPLTLRDFSDVMAEFPSLHVPRYVPPYGFEPSLMPDLERRYYERVVALYESYFRRRAVFDTSVAERFIQARPSAGGRPYLRRLLRYGMRVGYFRPSPPPGHVQGEVLAAGGAVRP
jgi:nucleoside-diphosphate-sugar epimerase